MGKYLPVRSSFKCGSIIIVYWGVFLLRGKIVLARCTLAYFAWLPWLLLAVHFFRRFILVHSSIVFE